MMGFSLIVVATVLCVHPQASHGFYLPGVTPHSYEKGEIVKLKVNKLTSVHTQLDLDYYRLPFCQPKVIVRDNENLGEFLSGDKIENSPFLLRMQEDMYCEHLCVNQVGPEEREEGKGKNHLVRAIRKGYHINWIVDNLPAASKIEDDVYITTRYWQGFPVGFTGEDRKVYINNHVNIEIQWHQVEGQPNHYRIVRFVVEPFSIKHDIDINDDGVVEIKNPIASCDPYPSQRVHTDYEMITERGRQPQIAFGHILFTYDVIWIENPDLHWASRWDIYLTMDKAVPAKVHWMALANSTVVILLLIGVIASILVRNLRRDMKQYHSLLATEEAAQQEGSGGVSGGNEFRWMLVHGDVFRPPRHNSLLLSVACGTGAQLLCMTFGTILFATFGYMSPARRGHLLQGLIFMYCFLGCVNGYVTARLYTTFQGTNFRRANRMAAVGFPGICFIGLYVLNFVAIANDSTDAVSYFTLSILLFLWGAVSVPLVYLGSNFGRKHGPLEFPLQTSSIPSEIPQQTTIVGRLPAAMLLTGLLSFGSCFLELYYIMASIWMEYYYYAFGFLMLVFWVLLITSSATTIVFVYFQLCRGNYGWWWRSFCISGSCAIYVFLWSFVYFAQLEASTWSTHVLYFAYMGVVSLAMFCALGSIGTFASLCFIRLLFSSVKIDQSTTEIMSDQEHSLYMEMS